MENEYKEVKFSKEEFNYVKNLFYNLCKVENKIPKSLKTRNSIILKELNNRFQRIVFN